jgi:hypothetical protein
MLTQPSIVASFDIVAIAQIFGDAAIGLPILRAWPGYFFATTACSRAQLA